MNSTDIKLTNHTFSGVRIAWRLNQPFALTMRRLRSTLKSPSPLKLLFYSKFGGKSRLENYLKAVGGEIGLMILGTVENVLINKPR
jgi:hypothetical protein